MYPIFKALLNFDTTKNIFKRFVRIRKSTLNNTWIDEWRKEATCPCPVWLRACM